MKQDICTLNMTLNTRARKILRVSLSLEVDLLTEQVKLFKKFEYIFLILTISSVSKTIWIFWFFSSPEHCTDQSWQVWLKLADRQTDLKQYTFHNLISMFKNSSVWGMGRKYNSSCWFFTAIVFPHLPVLQRKEMACCQLAKPGPVRSTPLPEITWHITRVSPDSVSFNGKYLTLNVGTLSPQSKLELPLTGKEHIHMRTHTHTGILWNEQCKIPKMSENATLLDGNVYQQTVRWLLNTRIPFAVQH